MFNPRSLSEQLLFSTIRMKVLRNNDEISLGTGFFFTPCPVEEPGSTYIITNKHVVEDGNKGLFTVHEGHRNGANITPTGNFFDIELDQLQKYCIFHPDPEIDLCAIPTEPLESESDQIGRNYFSVQFDSTMILNDKELEELTAIEDVFLIGYPLGLWDEYNNLPIIRRGITASHPSVDFCGKSITIIDVACFPGSSGSPVVLLNEGIFHTQNGTVIGDRIALLGILYGGPFMTIEGEIEVREIPTARKRIVESEIPIHLGYTVKAREILSMGLT